MRFSALGSVERCLPIIRLNVVLSQVAELKIDTMAIH